MGSHTSSLTKIACSFVLSFGAATAAAESPTSALYSHEAVQRQCIEAQKSMAGTMIEAFNVSHVALDSFTFGSSAPYGGGAQGTANLSAYHGKQASSTALPLTVQQLVSYGTVPNWGWRYPEVVSCKMKDAESINNYFGAGSATGQSTCKSVNATMVAEVYAALSAWEQRTLAWQLADIVLDDDIIEPTGPDWLQPLPFAKPAVIYAPGDGKLHIKSDAVVVDRLDPTPSTIVGPDKKGVYYCHFPSPEHLWLTIRGFLTPCVSQFGCLRPE